MHTARFPDRQPVHTVYGGAHLFRPDTARKLGELARQAMATYAPDPETFAEALGPAGGFGRGDREGGIERRRSRTAGAQSPDLEVLYARVMAKLADEPVEDFRIDFEDGYGYRSDEEEDAHAVAAARAVVAGRRDGLLPASIGLRIKPLTPASAERGLRTLERFWNAFAEGMPGEEASVGGRTADGANDELGGSDSRSHSGDVGGRLPVPFWVNLPKVTEPEQVARLADALDEIERRLGLPDGVIGIEIMIETPAALMDPGGACPIRRFVAAGRGRCRAAHFGVFDFTSSLEVPAMEQTLSHPACDWARHAMQVALAGSGVWLADGVTNTLPLPPHRAAAGESLSPAALDENRWAVRRGWRAHYADVRHSLRHGFHQGWDVHPNQLPTRYAAVFAHYLANRDAVAARLRQFLAGAAQASRVGSVFDDAASGQALVQFFRRGLACGALAPEDAAATGVAAADLLSHSFETLCGRPEPSA